MLGPLLGEGMTWRDNPERRRAYTQVTWLWFAMFAVRLAVQLPLYLLGMTVALGWVKLAHGLAALRAGGLDELPGADARRHLRGHRPLPPGQVSEPTTSVVGG